MAFNGPGDDAVHAEDGLVVVAVQVGNVEKDVGRDDELEEVEGTAGFVTTLEKGDADFADFYGMVHDALPSQLKPTMLVQTSNAQISFGEKEPACRC